MNSIGPSIALERLLTALEFGTRKEDKAFTDRLLNAFGLARRKKHRLIVDILAGPGFEKFFVATAREAQPFARMLRSVYEFLSRQRATAERRADVFRVSGAGARTAFNFDLDAFPKEVERILQKVESAVDVMRLNFGNDAEAAAPFAWWHSATEVLWNGASPKWDGDFYDDSFFRVVSYARRILSDTDPAVVASAEALITPIMERLRALTDTLQWEEFGPPPPDLQVSSYMNGEHEELLVQLHPPLQARLNRPQALAYFRKPLTSDSSAWSNQSPDEQTILSQVQWTLRSMAVAVHLWETHYVRREDRDDWLAKTLKTPFDSIRSSRYVSELLEPFAEQYSAKLDALFEIDQQTVTEIHEALIEFFGLPFWKDRWFLYELWTLCHTLAVAESRFPIALQGLEQRKDDVTEWRLPGGLASAPVATIGAPAMLECWTQRKTFHPLTGAGLEPDLRITRATPDHSDVFIAENKDRRKPRKSGILEILQRYVTGTTARCVCMINYETFTGPTHELATAVPGRDVLFLSNFRPNRPPNGDFESRLLQALEGELGVPPQQAVAPNPKRARADVLKINLTWQAEPHDLDLHAWIEHTGKLHHVHYPARGDLNQPPHALLGPDATHAPGHESLELRTEGLVRAVIAVHRYSPTVALSASGAAVEIYGSTMSPVRFDRVPRGTGDWWHVAEIDGDDLSLRVSNQLADTPPMAI